MLPLNRNHFLLCPFIRSATSSRLPYSTAEDTPKGLIIINVEAAFSSAAAAAPLNKIKTQGWLRKQRMFYCYPDHVL